MTFSTVCISRDVGAGGEQVGRAVADSLGFRYVDEDIVRAAAERAGVDVADVSSAEQRRTLAGRVLDLVAQAGAPEAYAYATPDMDAYRLAGAGDGMMAVIQEAVRETADAGSAVIVAHAASHVLAGRPDVLRVLVTGSADARQARLTADVGEEQARSAIREGEKARADYLRRFHDVKQELPTHYDLVVNTDQLGVDGAAAVITGAARG
ncbi:MAG TPA: cytidylate kinase-like family protein [Gaiellales bacterium]|nr:cytidylate kinase-like family protein [Gaiellales bacterium]